jgi:GNAT superfamily N-acetyltransferase
VRIDRQYLEQACLRDGTPVRLRLVRPEDKALIVEGWSHLSPESRYRRFLSGRADLKPSELRYLTEVDGVDHVALGAISADQAPRGLGIARFLRLAGRPDVAEAAIVVVDDMQRKGLGRLLLDRLAEAARERGIARFSSELLATNAAATALVHAMAPHAVLHPDGQTLTVEIPLQPEAPRPLPTPVAGTEGPLVRLLALAAEGRLVLARTLEELGELGEKLLRR